MAYVQPNTANQKATTFIVVGALHAVAFIALLNGLGVAFGPPAEDTRVRGENFPLPRPTPTETPKVLPTETAKDDRTIYIPPPAGGASPNPLSTGNPFGEVGTGGGTDGGTGSGEIDFPSPSPSVTPSFTPRSPRARGDRSRWVTNDDYPAREANLGHEGLTAVRLSVGANGQVTGCEITASSGWPVLDRASCTWLTRRARFEPATGSDGEATAGHYSTSVRWRLPDE